MIPLDPGGEVDGAAGEHLARDDGVASVWAATAVAVLLTVFLLVLHLAAAIAARHRAGSAADLAALAAATQAVYGDAAACARAAAIAQGMQARVAHCGLVGWRAAVEVHVDLPIAVPGVEVAIGRAVAGPATSIECPEVGRDGCPAGNQSDIEDKPVTPRPMSSGGIQGLSGT